MDQLRRAGRSVKYIPGAQWVDSDYGSSPHGPWVDHLKQK